MTASRRVPCAVPAASISTGPGVPNEPLGRALEHATVASLRLTPDDMARRLVTSGMASGSVTT